MPGTFELIGAQRQGQAGGAMKVAERGRLGIPIQLPGARGISFKVVAGASVVALDERNVFRHGRLSRWGLRRVPRYRMRQQSPFPGCNLPQRPCSSGQARPGPTRLMAGLIVGLMAVKAIQTAL